MKRFSKVLALCIFLAIALSVLAVFSVGAESAADEPVVTYDMHAKIGAVDTIPKKAVDITDADGNVIGKSTSLRYNTLDDGTPYYSEIIMGQAQADGTYSTVESSSNAYYQISPTTTNIADSTKRGAKNTDFMVVDFDLSTNDNLFDGFYFHTRWRTAADATSQANYPHFGADEIDNTFWVASRDDLSKKATASADITSDWINVTLVYDFRGTEYSGWNCHVYLDGIYGGSIAPCKSDAANLYFMRISYNKTQTEQISSANFANFTVKRFPVGYSGALANNVENLGNAGYTLDDFSDLAYCLENTPTQSVTKSVATITRGEEKIDVKKTSDFGFLLKDGDVVDLHRSTTTPVLVPAGANITWNTNGYNAPVVNEYDPTAAFVATNLITGELIQSGAAADLYSALYANRETDTKITLFSDVEYAASEAVTGYGDLVIDLNGHKLTLNGSAHVFTPQSGAKIRIKNGSLDFANTGNTNLAMINYSVYASLENMTSVTASTGYLFDQRAGYVLLKDCKSIDTANAVANAKSMGKIQTKLILENCAYTSLANAFDVSNVNQSQVGRFGSLNTKIVIKNSTVTALAGELVCADVYANACGSITDGVYTETTNERYLANANKLALSVSDSTVNVGKNVLNGNIASTTNVNNGNPANGMTLDVDLDITNSTIDATYLLRQAGGDEAVDYSYNADITVDTGFLNLTGGAFVDKAIASEKATVSMLMGGEIQLTTNKVAADGILGTSFEVVAPYRLLNRSVTETNKYTHAITTKCAPYPIVLNGEETEIEWYAEDVLTLADLPDDLLPPANPYLSYEWIYNENGAFEAVRTGDIPVSANLTLKNSFTFNVYIPADLDAATYETVFVNGVATDVEDVEVDGVAYKVIKATDVNPADADEKISVKFTAYIGGVRIETIVKRLSILDYAKTALESEETSADDKALVASVVNYVAAAQAYVGKTSAALDEVIASDEYKNALPTADGTASAVNTLAAAGAFDRVYLTLGTSFTYTFVTKADFVGDLTFTYLKGGVETSETVSVNGIQAIEITLDSCDALGTVKCTAGSGVGEINVAAYLDGVSANAPELAALADAIKLYAQEASAK